MIFVDTGAWYASLVLTDPDHSRAVQWLVENHSPLLTTDYVIDETLTLLRVRGERKRALALGARFFHYDLAEIHKVTTADLTLAWQTFEQFDDKNWSFANSEVFKLFRKDCSFSDVALLAEAALGGEAHQARRE